MHNAHAARAAAFAGELITALVAHPGCDVDATDAQGLTALHLCVTLGRPRVFRQLLASGRCDLRVRNKLGWNVLHTAAFRNLLPVARALLEARISPDERSADGSTAQERPGLIVLGAAAPR